MANQATTTYKVTGTRKAVNNLWNTFQSMEVNNKNIWLSDLAKHYGIDYEAKQICVRGHIYWAEYEEDEDVCLLSFEVYYTHDEGNYFPEECCVSASGKPFEECCDDVYGTIEEAIKEWTSKTGIEQGERTNEQMMDFINEYEYENDETYFYIRTFTFE